MFRNPLLNKDVLKAQYRQTVVNLSVSILKGVTVSLEAKKSP